MAKTKSNADVIDGIEVYTHDIYRYADEYIETELDGDRDRATEYFTDMIFYIADRIPKPGHDDIEFLDQLFLVYMRLCSKYKVLPTLEMFAFLIKTAPSTFTDWSKGEYRSSQPHSKTVKKWRDMCKTLVINRLTNQRGTDANLIFIAKAAYGMAETAPISQDEWQKLDARTPEQIAEQYAEPIVGLPQMPDS